MHIKCTRTGIWSRISIVLIMLLFVMATMFVLPQNTKVTYASSGITNPLDGYTTDEGFDTITGEVYNGQTNPYKIATANDLIKLAYYVNIAKDITYATASYRMDSHINLASYDWQPIGNETTPFSGVFDGYGYSIYGLTITTNTVVVDAGLFGYVATKTYNSTTYKPIIRLLGIKDASIVSNASYVGSIAGRVVGNGTQISYLDAANVTADALVQECYSVSFVSGSGIIGGLVGELRNCASIFNCYTAPSSNNVKDIDILCTSKTGSAGGIVGKVVSPTEEAKVPAVKFTYTTCAVAKSSTLGDTTNVRGIIGDISEIGIDYANIYSKSVSSSYYYSSNCRYNQDTTIRGVSLSNLKMSSNYTGWSIVAIANGVWNSYNRGDEPGNIWRVANVVNNKFPVLTRVPQLSKITLDANLEGNPADKSTYVKYYFNGYEDIENPTNTSLTALKPIIIDQHNFYVEQGQSVNIFAKYIEAAGSPLYIFDDWTLNVRTSSAVSNVNEKSDSAIVDAEDKSLYPAMIGILGSDCIYAANLIYKPYLLNVSANSASLGKLKLKISQTGTLGAVDWTDIDYIDNTTYVNRDCIVRVEANPEAGQKVNYWKLNNSAIMDNSTHATFSGNVYEFELDGDSNILVNFGPKTFQFSIRTADGTKENVANLSYSINKGEKKTASVITDMAYGSVVDLYAEITDVRYRLDYWLIEANGMTSYKVYHNLEDEFETIKIEDYENYVVTAYLEKQKFTISISTDYTDVADLSFVGSDKGSIEVEFDVAWTIKVENIKDGYYFKGWEITSGNETYGGGLNKNETFTMTETLAHWDCKAIFGLNEYIVKLALPENAVYADKEANKEYTVIYGDRFEVKVVPTSGYFLKQWEDGEGNVLSVEDTLNLAVTDNITLIPIINIQQFTVKIYSILKSTDGSLISIGNDCYVIQGTNISVNNSKFNEGSDVNFKAQAPTGLVFKEFVMVTLDLVNYNVNNEEYDYKFNEDGTGAIYKIDRNIEIYCYFVRESVVLKFAVNESGLGDYSYEVGTNKGSYKNSTEAIANIGDVLILTNPKATDEMKHTFAYWLVNGEPYTSQKNGVRISLNEVIIELEEIEDTETVTYRKVINVVGVFDKIQYELQVTQNISGGNITGFEVGTYYYGDIVPLSTTVLPGYRFVGWYDISRTGEKLFLADDLLVNCNIEKRTKILAEYVKQGAVYAVLSDEKAGIVSGEGSFDIGKTVELEVETNSDYYEFLYWTMGGEIIGKDKTLTITVLEDINIVDVVFGKLHSINVTVNNARLGIAKGVPVAKLGELVTVRATPAGDAGFVGWFVDGNLISTDANYKFTVNGSLSMEAKFQEQINTGTILIVAGCLILAILLIIIIVYFVKQKERKKLEEGTLRSRHNVFDMYNVDENENDIYTPRGTLTAIPVRKVTVPPRDYKGNIKTLKYEPVDVQEYKRGRGRPKGSLNKKGRKTIAPMYPGQRGRPKGSLNKKGRKVYELKAPGKRGRPLGSKNRPKF